MTSPHDINKALLAFNNGEGLKKFSKEAKSHAIKKKRGFTEANKKGVSNFDKFLDKHFANNPDVRKDSEAHQKRFNK